MFNLSLLGICTRCDEQENLVLEYLTFLQLTLVPELQTFVHEQCEWWSFKPTSTLAQYINSLEYSLELSFRPVELFNIIKNIADSHHMFALHDSELIIPNKSLYRCLLSWHIPVKKLYKYCLPHIWIVGKNYKHFSLKSPSTLLYQDPSSVFWLHPTINNVISKNKKITYSWRELCHLFATFICTNQVVTFNRNRIYLKPNSFLCKELKLKYIEKTHIPTVLSFVTKFLGKSHNLLSLCKDLKFEDPLALDNFVKFIENLIVFNVDVTPEFSPYFYL